jgi:hypothetical protein
LKGEAFSEEKESRLVNVSPCRSGIHDYRMRADVLIPFLKVPYQAADDDRASLIAEVILGPTNSTPVEVVQAFLESHGVRAVVVQSTASYRL